eukprot:CAMPEP_0198112224 /NCGR_PEP_ID=MMETSP1442-20131203/4104_1 /TAXON_ID= /ORGANISM="Craspedostauros australis, Strain CCMP3328" /LENGTH=488 /DNA_ID=CAMNT_0043768931 /DNA_START=474 /DNA_END=1940 /DNA_ORIENTATION=+
MASSTRSATAATTQSLSTFQRPFASIEHPNHDDTPNFIDASLLAHRSTGEWLRAAVCLQLCQFPFLVRNAEVLLHVSRTILGRRVTNEVLRRTFFGHFCAGEDEHSIQPVLRRLQQHSIGGILDYAVESDGSTQSLPEIERQCDERVPDFQKCVRAAANNQDGGYVAVKMTALANPQLLARVSTAIVESRRRFDAMSNDGRDVTGDGLKQIISQDAADSVQRSVDGKLDPVACPSMTGSHHSSQLAEPQLSSAEMELLQTVLKRAGEVADTARQNGVRLLIDAEQSKYQPAIDHIVMLLQRQHNAAGAFPVVYNTYQCYLKDATHRIQQDVERAKREGYSFGAKLVRGAYMETEPAELIHDSIQDTHDCYNHNVRYLLQEGIEHGQIEIMCATHNAESIALAVDAMQDSVDPSNSFISFAQLYGMSDTLSYPLASRGYRVYKYLPYGQIDEVMPYLIRRAQENSSIAGGSQHELSMMWNAWKRRMWLQ